MTADQFDNALRAFCRRRPFVKFYVEFDNANRVVVSHPEAIRREGDLYAMRLPDGGNVVFAADSVSRLLDISSSP